ARTRVARWALAACGIISADTGTQRTNRIATTAPAMTEVKIRINSRSCMRRIAAVKSESLAMITIPTPRQSQQPSRSMRDESLPLHRPPGSRPPPDHQQRLAIRTPPPQCPPNHQSETNPVVRTETSRDQSSNPRVRQGKSNRAYTSPPATDAAQQEISRSTA